MGIPFNRRTISSFGLGIIVGSLVMLLFLGLMLRLLTRDPSSIPPVSQPGAVGISIVVPRDTLQYMIDDALTDITIPLVTLHDPSLQLEPGALLVLRLRGDTALLGGQTIVLRMRLVPINGRLGVATESADIGGRINITGAMTQQLDEQINAILMNRLPIDDQLEVVGVRGTTDEIVIEAQLRERNQGN